MGQKQSIIDVNALPKDLLLAQTLKLNYPDTLMYCENHPRLQNLCETGELWEYKILNELGIDKEKYLPTSMPLNLKYLEIKSKLGVDIGSEYYIELRYMTIRAARVRDSLERTRLLNHIGNNNRFSLQYIITGLIAIGDEELASEYINTLGSPLSGSSEEKELEERDLIIAGYAEGGQMDKIYKMFETAPQDLASNNIKHLIQIGLVRGGHLGRLKEYGTDLAVPEFILINEAAIFGRQEIVVYLLKLFKETGVLVNKSSLMFDLIMNNDDYFITSIWSDLVTPLDNIIFYIEDALKSNSRIILDHIRELYSLDNMERRQFNKLIQYAIYYNHIDMAIYFALKYAKPGYLPISGFNAQSVGMSERRKLVQLSTLEILREYKIVDESYEPGVAYL